MSEKNTIDNCENCPVQWKNFQHLTKEELHLVNENRYEATFKQGEIIIKQGSPASNALFIASGMAKNYYEGINGKNFILSILLPGRLIMGPGAYVNSRYTYSVSALTPLQACFINFDIFRHLVRINGDFAESLLQDISIKSLWSHIRMINLAQKKMPGRIAEALLYFSDDIFKADEFELILSRQELGEMTNMVKESVVRIIKEMEVTGVISVKSSWIRIIDKETLRQISERG
jgi:CRP/FNR family transcriptional regulator, polysaccharide utilization system transcription regulator